MRQAGHPSQERLSDSFPISYDVVSMQNQYLINGKPNACLTPFDRGFAYGDGVFRTLPVIKASPQCWDQHYRKLSEDCNALGIVCPSADLLLDDIATLCKQDLPSAIKIIVTRGESARGYAVPALAQPARVVIRSDMPDYPAHHSSEGVALHLCHTRLAAQPRLAGVKHLNRLENVLARMEWVDAHIADGVLLDHAGNVIECTMSNLFVREGDVLMTPDLSQCGVAGVTRQRILDLSTSLGYTTKVTSIALERMLMADEVVICNSLYGVWQVRQLENKRWPAGTLAEVLRKGLAQ